MYAHCGVWVPVSYITFLLCAQVHKMMQGVVIDDVLVQPEEVSLLEESVRLRIVVSEGKKHEVSLHTFVSHLFHLQIYDVGAVDEHEVSLWVQHGNCMGRALHYDMMAVRLQRQGTVGWLVLGSIPWFG